MLTNLQKQQDELQTTQAKQTKIMGKINNNNEEKEGKKFSNTVKEAASLLLVTSFSTHLSLQYLLIYIRLLYTEMSKILVVS
jgi:hypothetical protein